MVPFTIYKVSSWDFLASLNMKWLVRKVCQLVSIKLYWPQGCRIGANPPKPFSAAGRRQQSAAWLSCTHQPAALQNVLTLTKCHIQEACGQVWKHCLKSYCRFSQTCSPPSWNLQCKKWGKKATEQANKLHNYKLWCLRTCNRCFVWEWECF